MTEYEKSFIETIETDEHIEDDAFFNMFQWLQYDLLKDQVLANDWIDNLLLCLDPEQAQEYVDTVVRVKAIAHMYDFFLIFWKNI